MCRAIAENSDQFAFEEIHCSYFNGLLSYAMSILKDANRAEEVINDVFVNLWHNRKTIQTINNLSNYLYISVKHTCLNVIKSKDFNIQVKHTLLGDVSEEYYEYQFQSPESLLISAENLKIISQTINTLPPKCRLVFRLVKEEGLKYKEVADLLNISERTVHNHMLKALSFIISKLKSMFPEFYVKAN